MTYITELYQESSGVLNGGVLSVGSPDTTYSVSGGSGQLVNSIGQIKKVDWVNLTNIVITDPAPLRPSGAPESNKNARSHTYVWINEAGSVLVSSTEGLSDDLRDFIFLGALVHTNLTTNVIDSIDNKQMFIRNIGNQLRDLSDVIGIINERGNVMIKGAGAFQLVKSEGEIYSFGSNYNINSLNPNIVTLPEVDTGSTGTFQYRMKDGSSSALTLTDFVPTILDDGTPYPGTTLSVNQWGVSRVFTFISNDLKIQPPQYEYGTSDEAISKINSEAYITEPSFSNGLLIGYIVAKENAVDLTSAIFIKAPKFGGNGGGASSGLDISTKVNIDGTSVMTGGLILRETTAISPLKTITITAPTDVTTSHDLVLPSALGSNGSVLTDTVGDGVLTWAVPSAGVIPGGTVVGAIQYNDGSSGLDADDTHFTYTLGTKTLKISNDDTGILTGLKNPTTNFQAANKAYVDSIAGSGVSWKTSAVVMSATSQALTALIDSNNGGLIIDGHTFVNGDRILLAGQGGNVTTPHADNGIYKYVDAAGGSSGSSFIRTDDTPVLSSASGSAVFVEKGTYDNQGWIVTTDDANFGDAIAWSQFNAQTAVSGITNSVQFTADTSTLSGSSDFTWDGTFLQLGDAKAFVSGAGDELTIVHGGSAGVGSITNTVGIFTIENTSSSDVVLKLGDALGSTKVSIKDNADVEVFSVNSDGLVAFTDSGVGTDKIYLKAGDGVTTHTLTLPSVLGTGGSNYILTDTVGDGVLSWAVSSAGVIAGGTVVGAIQYNDGSSGLDADDTHFTYTLGTKTLKISNDDTGIITGLADPINISDAVNKGYTDSIIPYDIGLDYTERTPTESTGWYGPAYGNGRFIAVSSSGTDQVMISDDNGVTWQTRSAPQPDTWRDIAYGNGVFVAIAYSGAVMTSTNGETWALKSSPNVNTFSIAYGGGIFVVVSLATDTVMTSDDNGQTWISRTGTEVSQWRGITYGNGVFVAVSGTATNQVMTSSNGTDWLPYSATEPNNWYSVVYGNGRFVAVSSTGTNQVMTSDDNGQTWQTQSATESNTWYSVAYGDGLFVAVANVGTTHQVMTSPDGAIWTSLIDTYTYSMHGVGFGIDNFVTVGPSGVSTIDTFKNDYLNVNNGIFNISIKAKTDLSADHTLFLPSTLGSVGAVLTDTAGDGILDWAIPEVVVAAGVDTQIQFNSGGNTFAGSADFTWNDTTKDFTVLGDTTTNNLYSSSINQTGKLTQEPYKEYNSDVTGIVSAVATPITTSGGSDGCGTDGRFLYVGSRDGGLDAVFSAYDIRGPIPVLASSFSDRGTNSRIAFSRGIVVRGKYAYVSFYGSATTDNAGFSIIDVSDPYNLTSADIVGDLSGAPFSKTEPSGVQRCTVHGDFAYIVSSSTTVTAVNISNPASPIIPTNGTFTVASGAVDIHVNSYFSSGSEVTILTVSSSTGLEIYDVSDLTGTTAMAKGSINSLSGIKAMKVIGDRAYIVDGTTSVKFYIVDISDKNNPFIVNSLVTLSGTTTLFVFEISGNRAYLFRSNNSPNSDTVVIDIEDENNISEIGYNTANGMQNPYGSCQIGNKIFTTPHNGVNEIYQVELGANESFFMHSESDTMYVKDQLITADFTSKGNTRLLGNTTANKLTVSSMTLKEPGDTNLITLAAPTGITTDYTITLPVDGGENKNVLITNGSGTTSWVSSNSNYSITSVNATTYTVLPTDDIIGVPHTSTADVTITLPLITSVGFKKYTVIDFGGNSSVFNITIAANAADTILGDADIVLRIDYNTFTLVNDGSNTWFIM
jgi:hypothetical protein